MTFHTLRRTFFLLLAVGFTATVFADGPADNKIENVRRIPKLGVDLTPTERDSLNDALIEYG